MSTDITQHQHPFTNGEFNLDLEPHPVDGFRVMSPGIARALGFRDAFRLMESIPDVEKGYTLARTPGGEQRVGYLTEAGFYRALGQRQAARIADNALREMVERFQTWVYRDVLPSIRMTGGYQAPAPELDEIEVAERYVAALREKKALAARVAELEPEAQAWQVLIERVGSQMQTVSQAAALLDEHPRIHMGRNRLFKYMHEEMGWIFRDGLGNWTPHQKVRDRGLLRFPLAPEDVTHWDNQVMVTPKGFQALWNHMTAPFFAQPELPLEPAKRPWPLPVISSAA